MCKNPVSTSSAKDESHYVDLDELALVMHADATGMTDQEFAVELAKIMRRREIRRIRRQEIRRIRRQETINALTAVAFLIVSTVAIVITIVFWNWK